MSDQKELNKTVGRLANGKDADILKYIQEAVNVDIQDSSGLTLLHHAVEKRNLSRVKILIEAKCNVNLFDRQNNSALMMSVHRNQEEISRFLLENGANPNQNNSSQNTPLSIAVWVRNRRLVELLLKYGADCNTNCNVYMDRYSPSSSVIFCVKHKYNDILQCIIDNGQVSMSKQLMLCYEHRCLDEFSYFLTKGADPFEPVYSVPTYNDSQVQHVFDRVLIGAMQNHHIFKFGEKTCQYLLIDYGNTTSNYNGNKILQTLLTCKLGPSSNVKEYYERFYADFAVGFLQFMVNFGISYHDYGAQCRCLSNFHDRKTCQIINKLRNKFQEPEVKRSLLQGFVLPLQYQCRRAIRSTLSLGVSEKIDRLPLPSLTKLFLKFTGEVQIPCSIFCGKVR